MKSQIFTTAWAFFRENIFETFSQALSAAWKVVKAKTMMRTDGATLTFLKADGTRTTRLATLNHQDIPSTAGAGRRSRLDLLTFWSLTDNGWRSCRVERLVAVK